MKYLKQICFTLLKKDGEEEKKQMLGKKVTVHFNSNI